MSLVGDVFQSAGNMLFGTSGNMGGGFEGFSDYFNWVMKQQEAQRTLADRELEQSKALIEFRRSEIQDRSGYAGLVNVGDATLRSDATLAAEMEKLDTTINAPQPPPPSTNRPTPTWGGPTAPPPPPVPNPPLIHPAPSWGTPPPPVPNPPPTPPVEPQPWWYQHNEGGGP
jgi:hypothetical protein